LELIQDKKTGVIFKSDNPDALVTEVLDLLSRQDRWPALRAAARNYVETERNWPVSVARYKDVYGSLVNKEILG
jgi:glycosyltransferase involved in cell wall biosynthesis